MSLANHYFKSSPNFRCLLNAWPRLYMHVLFCKILVYERSKEMFTCHSFVDCIDIVIVFSLILQNKLLKQGLNKLIKPFLQTLHETLNQNLLLKNVSKHIL